MDEFDEWAKTIKVYEDFLKENVDLDDSERKSILKDIAIEKGNLEALNVKTIIDRRL
jgi:hypothetical protein